ncbi:hypothetical protein GF373_16065, partial [bacterium]|nr:hypothetical protein [bacterium]
MTNPNLFTEDPIDELTGGYRTTQVVVTAARLGVFAKLEEVSHDHESLASELQTDARATRILCDALVSLELLIKQDGKYKNSPIAAQYLVPYSTHSKLGMMHHIATLYET